MLHDPVLAGAFQISQILERSEYSALAAGTKRETGLPVLVRHWFSAHATTPKAQAQIQAEVAALQQIQHPSLLPLLEIHTSPQGVLLVSPFPVLGSLHDRLQQQDHAPLPVEEALQLIQQIGQGLHALHQQNRIHGNLTPHAVFFSELEHARLGEFRLQSILDCIEHYQPALDESTPRCWYMAPEQFQGRASAQSDQYALACLAYQLLAGQVPFAGSARATLLQKHQRDRPPSLREHNPAIPLRVEETLFKALAKHPAQRYSSVQALLDALEGALHPTIADMDTIHFWEETGVDQEAEAQRPFDVVLEVDFLDEEPVTAATWSRTRTITGGIATGMHMSSERDRERKQPVRRSLSTRGFFALLALVFLVLMSMCAGGRWLVSSEGQALQQSGSAHTALVNGQATATSTATNASSLVPSPTPSVVPSSTVAPTPTSPGQGLATIVPVVDCVTLAGGNLIAHIGYRNPNAFAVTLPQGKANVVSPSSLDGSQPTTFAPGVQQDVFQLTFFKRQTVSWLLDGSTATASSNSPLC